MLFLKIIKLSFNCNYLIKSCFRPWNYIYSIDYWTQRGCLTWKWLIRGRLWQNEECLGPCFFPYGIVERIVGMNEMSVRRVQERRETLQLEYIGQS